MGEKEMPSEGNSGSPALAYADPATPRPHVAASTSRWDVAAIILKLTGIYLVVVQGLPALAHAVDYGTGGTTRFSRSLALLYGVLFVLFSIFGLVLMLTADRLAGWLLPRLDGYPTAAQTPTSARGVQEVAFSVLGIYLVAVDAIPGLAMYLWRWVAEPDSAIIAHTDVAPFIVEHLVQLVVGLWLFFGSRQLANYWQRRRWEADASRERDGAL